MLSQTSDQTVVKDNTKKKKKLSNSDKNSLKSCIFVYLYLALFIFPGYS